MDSNVDGNPGSIINPILQYLFGVTPSLVSKTKSQASPAVQHRTPLEIFSAKTPETMSKHLENDTADLEDRDSDRPDPLGDDSSDTALVVRPRGSASQVGGNSEVRVI